MVFQRSNAKQHLNYTSDVNSLIIPGNVIPLDAECEKVEWINEQGVDTFLLGVWPYGSVPWCFKRVLRCLPRICLSKYGRTRLQNGLWDTFVILKNQTIQQQNTLR